MVGAAASGVANIVGDYKGIPIIVPELVAFVFSHLFLGGIILRLVRPKVIKVRLLLGHFMLNLLLVFICPQSSLGGAMSVALTAAVVMTSGLIMGMVYPAVASE